MLAQQDIPAAIVFCILAFIGLSLADDKHHRETCDYIYRVAIAQWMKWVDEFQRTGRWDH
jgi:hypothetical protein